MFLNPNDREQEFRINVIVPVSAGIIFGPLTGGLTGGLGNIVIDIYDIIREGDDTFGVTKVIGAISNFIGGWTVGYFSKRKERGISKFYKLIFSKSTWTNLIRNTIVSIMSFSLIQPFIVGYGVRYYQGVIEGEMIDGVSRENYATELFLRILFGNTFVILIFIPLILLFFEILQVIRNKRFIKIDERNKQLTINIYGNDQIVVEEVKFLEHSFVNNQWTSLELKFKSKMEKATRYTIELVSNSTIYPHLDSTVILEPGKTWTQKIFVYPSTEDMITLRVCISPDHTIRSKQKFDEDLFIDIKGRVTISKSTSFSGLMDFVEINILIVLISIIWNIFLSYRDKGSLNLNTVVSDHLDLYLTTGVIELILFIPFMIIMFQIQKPRVTEEMLMKLSHGKNTESHIYLDESNTETSYLKSRYYQSTLINLTEFFLAIFALIVFGYLFYEGRNWYLDDPFKFTETIIFISGIVGITLAYIAYGWIRNKKLAVEKSIEAYHEDEIIYKFNPLAPFREFTSSEVVVDVVNTTKLNGIRLVFHGSGIISPPMIELHLEPKENAKFKLTLTPGEQGNKELMVLMYPLFTKEGVYIPFDEAEPFNEQKISYQVHPQTLFGLTQSQSQIVQQLIVAGSFIGAAFAYANRFVKFEHGELLTQFRDLLPGLLAMQIPFFYSYFYLRNKIPFLKIKSEFEKDVAN
jgi:hypothetical protein